nr:GNAT family N-acetyltransferase [Desulfobulbaceae bacterium]
MINVNTITFRKADPGDTPQLIELLRALFAIEEDFLFNEEKQRVGLQLMLDNQRGYVAVAEKAGTIIGMCTGQLTISTAEGGPALLVEDVVVTKKWRSQGVGKQLMAEVSRWAEHMGVSRLQLLADKTNSEALDFYKSLGWQSTQLICLRKYIQ